MAQAEARNDSGATQILGHAPLPPITGVNGVFGDGATPMRWTGILVWFMRVIALVWIAKGLYGWSVILGANLTAVDFKAATDFATLPLIREATIIFFAVADLVAAIGLWLASPWGGVLWLISAICEAALPLVGVKSSLASSVGLAVNAVLIAVYFGLSWRASSERA